MCLVCHNEHERDQLRERLAYRAATLYLRKLQGDEVPDNELQNMGIVLEPSDNDEEVSGEDKGCSRTEAFVK